MNTLKTKNEFDAQSISSSFLSLSLQYTKNISGNLFKSLYYESKLFKNKIKLKLFKF